MKKSTVGLIKAGVGIIVSIGVGSIVGNIIKTTTPSDVKRINKIFIDVAGLVLMGLVAKKANDHIGEQIDSMMESDPDEGEKVEGEPEVELA